MKMNKISAEVLKIEDYIITRRTKITVSIIFFVIPFLILLFLGKDNFYEMSWFFFTIAIGIFIIKNKMIIDRQKKFIKINNFIFPFTKKNYDISGCTEVIISKKIGIRYELNRMKKKQYYANNYVKYIVHLNVFGKEILIFSETVLVKEGSEFKEKYSETDLGAPLEYKFKSFTIAQRIAEFLYVDLTNKTADPEISKVFENPDHKRKYY